MSDSQNLAHKSVGSSYWDVISPFLRNVSFLLKTTMSAQIYVPLRFPESGDTRCENLATYLQFMIQGHQLRLKLGISARHCCDSIEASSLKSYAQQILVNGNQTSVGNANEG